MTSAIKETILFCLNVHKHIFYNRTRPVQPIELYFVIIRSPNYCSDSVPPGPRSRKRLFKARLQRKKPCVCDYFLLSHFRSALQDPDVLLVHHRFAFHIEREAIINMEQVSQSGPHEPVVQPCTGDHNNFLH